MTFFQKYGKYFKMAVLVILYIMLMFTAIPRFIFKPVANIYGNSYEGIRALTIFLNIIIYLILFTASLVLVPQIYYVDFLIFKKKPFVRSFLEIILGWIGLYGCSALGVIISTALSGENQSVNETIIDSIMSADGAWAYAFVAIVIGPIVEEIVFRGILQGTIAGSKFNKINDPRVIVSILASSIFFGLIHVISNGDYLQVFPYLFMGFGFGIVYYISKSLYTTMAIHILNNFVAIVIPLLLGWSII